MIGTKELALMTSGKKLIKKYEKNFSKFKDDEFCVRFLLNDEKVKAIEVIVNSDNWMDYLINGLDLEDYKVDKIEILALGK